MHPALIPSPAANHTGWLGPLDAMHRMQPKPFNPDYDPKAKARYAKVTASMVEDDYYATHTREQCGIEWRKRYAALVA